MSHAELGDRLRAIEGQREARRVERGKKKEELEVRMRQVKEQLEGVRAVAEEADAAIKRADILLTQGDVEDVEKGQIFEIKREARQKMQKLRMIEADLEAIQKAIERINREEAGANQPREIMTEEGLRKKMTLIDYLQQGGFRINEKRIQELSQGLSEDEKEDAVCQALTELIKKEPFTDNVFYIFRVYEQHSNKFKDAVANGLEALILKEIDTNIDKPNVTRISNILLSHMYKEFLRFLGPRDAIKKYVKHIEQEIISVSEKLKSINQQSRKIELQDKLFVLQKAEEKLSELLQA